MLEEILKLPDFRNVDQFWLALPVGDIEVKFWDDELVPEPLREELMLLIPFKYFSVKIGHDLAVPYREQAFSFAKSGLCKTMIRYLSDCPVFDKWLAVVMEKQILNSGIVLYLVAYEVKEFDLKNIRWLKDLPGLQFIWFYGGVLSLDHSKEELDESING